MSRYNFYDLITNIDDIEAIDGDDPNWAYYEDIIGLCFSTWTDDVCLGWDDGLETYFLSSCGSNSDAGPAWMFGCSYREISSPMALTAILDRLFNKHPSGKCFLYSKEMVDTLVEERNTYVRNHYFGEDREELSSLFARADETWSNCSGENIPFQYLQEHVREDYADNLAKSASGETNQVIPIHISRSDWLEAPHCPIGMRDPQAFGRALHAGLKRWAEYLCVPSENIRLWLPGSSDLKPYQDQDAAWQIEWAEGPENWAILLLHGESYAINGKIENGDSKCYFLEPADRTILGMTYITVTR